MRKITVVVACTVAASALGLVAASTAAAADYPLTGLPEVGRCVKTVIHKTGEFIGKNCVLISGTGTGEYEWKPGPGAKPKFDIEATEVTLVTVGGPLAFKGKVMGCAPSDIEGEWTSGKTASINVTLRGCVSTELAKSCQNNPQQQSQITNEEPLEGVLGFIEGGEKPKIGLDIKSKAGNLFPSLLKFRCGGPPEELTGPGEPWTIEGSVIGRVYPIDKMVTEFKAVYRATAGKQKPEKFAGTEPKDTLLLKREPKPLETTEAQAGLNLIPVEPQRPPVPGENEEPLEFKVKV